MEMTNLEDKYTALLDACKQQNVSIDEVDSLIESGVDVNIKDKNGMTALMFVIDRIHSRSDKQTVLTIINLLMRNNAEFNAQTKEGKTALMMVCEKCTPNDDRNNDDRNNFIFKICDTFITNPKIDLSIKDQDNKTALDYANENCNQNIKDLFSRHQAKPKRWWQKLSPAGGRRRKTIRRKSKRKSKRTSKRKYKI